MYKMVTENKIRLKGVSMKAFVSVWVEESEEMAEDCRWRVNENPFQFPWRR